MNTPICPTSRAASHEAAALVPHAPVSFRTAAWSVAAGMSFVIPLGLLVAALHLPAQDAAMQHVSAARLAPMATHPALLALHALLIAPLWEEFVYRGLILQMLRRYTPLWFAVLVPTCIFAGIHLPFSYQNAAQAAFVGLASSWLVCRSRSLLPSILFHSGINLTSLFILRPLVVSAGWTTLHELGYGWVALSGALSCAAPVLAYRRLRAQLPTITPAVPARVDSPLMTAARA